MASATRDLPLAPDARGLLALNEASTSNRSFWVAVQTLTPLRLGLHRAQRICPLRAWADALRVGTDRWRGAAGAFFER
jgi:hypothetical protein